MLIKGNTPQNEPLISIGLVLPEDKQKSILITNSQTKKKLIIKVYKGGISINGKIVQGDYILKSKNNQVFNLDQVSAGRGFHWSKKISLNVNGILLIRNIDKALFIVNQLKLEKYLICVATSEMSSSCPIALLESQTIAARSWILASVEQKHIDLNIDVCNDDCCQRYQGLNNVTDLASKAAKNTRGKVLTHQNKICDTRYSKSCGGISESNEHVWHDTPKPYLQSIYDSRLKDVPNLKNNDELTKWILNPTSCFCDTKEMNTNELISYLGDVDEDGSYFRWEYSLKQDQLCKLINIKLGTSFERIDSLKPIKRGTSARIIKLKIHGISLKKSINITLNSEYEIRRVLHSKFLYSSAFIILQDLNKNLVPTQFKFKGAGWGHGVGLCQIGALNMALNNYSTNKILFHYFQNTKLKKIYD